MSIPNPMYFHSQCTVSYTHLEKGRITIFDRSWYRRVLVDRFDGLTDDARLNDSFEEINSFERQLTDDGTIIIKFFLVISKKEQEARFKKLLDSKATSWRVSKNDIKRNKHYDLSLIHISFAVFGYFVEAEIAATEPPRLTLPDVPSNAGMGA